MRLAGCNEYGWVWTDHRAVHIYQPTGRIAYDHWRDFEVKGGTSTVLVYKPGCVLLVHLQYTPPRLTAYHLNRPLIRFVTASAGFAYLAMPTGLEVYTLPGFELTKHWPGDFHTLAPLPDDVLAAADAAGRIMFLKQTRWDSVVYAIDADTILSDHRIMFGYSGSWCPRHRHRVYNIPEGAVACVCDSKSQIFVTRRGHRDHYTVHVKSRPVWSFRTRAFQLESDHLVLVDPRREVQVWPLRWWGRRLALLFMAGVPLELLLRIKKVHEGFFGP